MVRVRLAAMMFLEYFIWGAWYVTVGTWLGRSLHFSGTQIALVAGTTAVGAIVSPFVAGWLADNFWSTEYVLAVLHAVGAVLLGVASLRTSFGSLYGLVLVYSLLYMPTLGLTNSLAFRHLRDPRAEFGSIRVLGTLGWIVAGLLVGGLHWEAGPLPLRLAAGMSAVMALYSLTLPRTPPLATQTRTTLSTIFPREILGLFRKRSFTIFILASFLLCVPLQFYYAFTNIFLNELGVHNPAGTMTLGQASELGCMLLIPWFFRRLGVKGMLIAGMAAWVLRYALFAYGNATSAVALLWLGIILHGICYDFFFVTGQIYVDRESSASIRAAAQGMFTLVTYGAGMMLGSWLSGITVDHYAIAGGTSHQWRSIWLVGCACSFVVLLGFIFLFHDRSREQNIAPLATGGSAP